MRENFSVNSVPRGNWLYQMEQVGWSALERFQEQKSVSEGSKVPSYSVFTLELTEETEEGNTKGDLLELTCRPGLNMRYSGRRNIRNAITTTNQKHTKVRKAYHQTISEKKQTTWPLVRKRTLPTERPALAGEF
jgi:hypothetical protein